jgi:uncharacterized protein (TIGR02646 family)
MIAIKKGSAPKILQEKGKTLTEKLRADFENGVEKFNFDSAVYGSKEVKSKLLSKAVQSDKCCFCESNITATGYGDVEHFRPKGGWIQKDNDKLSDIGYYWLAYDWDNLFCSCQICNQKFKKNYFPLENPTERATNHQADLELEKPLLIHPANDDPSQHLHFVKELVKHKTAKGRETIERTGIDRDELDERRREKYLFIKGLLDLLSVLNAGRIQEPKVQEVILTLQELVTPRQPYFAMVRDNFKQELAQFGILL